MNRLFSVCVFIHILVATVVVTSAAAAVLLFFVVVHRNARQNTKSIICYRHRTVCECIDME